MDRVEETPAASEAVERGQTDSGDAQAPAPKAKKAEEPNEPTLTDLRKRGLVYKGGGMTTGGNDKLLPLRDIPGYETGLYFPPKASDAQDLVRVLDTGWYALGPAPETE